MTNRATLIALAQRVEEAEGPDRNLDFVIFRALHLEYAGPEWREFGGGLWHVQDSSDARCLPPPERTPSRWTASLDAALTLVPDGYVVNLGNDEPIWAQVWIDNDPTSRGGGTTMALALCAAALRARAQMERGK